MTQKPWKCQEAEKNKKNNHLCEHCYLLSLPGDFEFLCLSLQLSAWSPVGQTAVCGGVGLGPHVQERLHGGAVFRSEWDLQAPDQRLVQTARPGRGGVLQHPCARPGSAGRINGRQGEQKATVVIYTPVSPKWCRLSWGLGVAFNSLWLPSSNKQQLPALTLGQDLELSLDLQFYLREIYARCCS